MDARVTTVFGRRKETGNPKKSCYATLVNHSGEEKKKKKGSDDEYRQKRPICLNCAVFFFVARPAPIPRRIRTRLHNGAYISVRGA